ncbi:HEAT repeat domain-containing protein [Streptomyces sp. NPDC001759]
MENTIQALVDDLSSREHAVRSAATNALVGLGPAAVGHLLPYTLDRRPRSPWRSVQSIIKCHGDDALPRLREIRREGPGRLRGGALEILVDLGGADALDETDRLAVERLVRVKILDERPVETPMEGGRWLAFPADGLDDAVTALGLYDVRPATSVMGVAAATQATDSLDFQDAQGETHRAYRVFITPEFENWRDPPIKNWRMLWGNSFLDELDGFRLARELSERCGEAHFYVLDPCNASHSWYVARDGAVVRSFGTYAYPQFEGAPLPFEVWYRENADEDEVEMYAEGVPDADTVADSLSVHPGPQLAKATHGHGWLATTHPDVPNTRFKGALPL